MAQYWQNIEGYINIFTREQAGGKRRYQMDIIVLSHFLANTCSVESVPTTLHEVYSPCKRAIFSLADVGSQGGEKSKK